MAKSAKPDAARRRLRQSELPLFYRSPWPLDPARHAGKSVRAERDCSFARDANAVPLNTVEFVPALRHYPIVFSASTPVMTLAVLGIDQDSNLFVDTDGQWCPGAYIPAYVRRYPFLSITGTDPARFVLGVDEAALDSGSEGEPLFADGEPSAAAKRALAFCSDFQAQVKVSQDFCETIRRHGLLVDQNATFEFKTGRRATVQGFRIVDEAKFQALPGDRVVEWRDNGYLPLLYAHLFSMRNWGSLLDMAAADGA